MEKDYMKLLLVAGVLVSLVSLGCGELVPTMSPSVTTVGCAAQTAGSTVHIFDQIPGCAVVDSTSEDGQ